MNEQELGELKKKMAEFAGFNLQTVWPEYCDLEKVLKWTYPDGSYHKEPPDFPQDLNACFKWLIPKAVDQLADIDLSSSTEAYLKIFVMWLKEAENNPVNALALCLAIEKLIDGGK